VPADGISAALEKGQLRYVAWAAQGFRERNLPAARFLTLRLPILKGKQYRRAATICFGSFDGWPKRIREHWATAADILSEPALAN
jgi:hypothetical protein